MVESKFQKIFKGISDYYGEKIRLYGPSPKGVDWNGVESQVLRFEQIAKLLESQTSYFSINDLGCGYGALIEFLSKKGYKFEYRGYDVSNDMLLKAKELWVDLPLEITFINSPNLLQADYSVASGVFNVKQDTDYNKWLNYVINSLDEMDKNSRKGFSFNMLTKYSDAFYMKEYLFYADPCFIFDYCKRNYSRNVSLLHDYNLYEFTIIVRKYAD